MLTKLLPDQISKFWDVIKYAIEQSLPPLVGEHPNKMGNILAACLDGSVTVWASYHREGEKTIFEGVLLTQILYDKPSRTKNLLLYCLYGYSGTVPETWLGGLEKLIRYCKAKKCTQIVAYTEVPYLVELAKKLGAEAKYTFISINVKKASEDLEEFMETFNESNN